VIAGGVKDPQPSPRYVVIHSWIAKWSPRKMPRLPRGRKECPRNKEVRLSVYQGGYESFAHVQIAVYPHLLYQSGDVRLEFAHFAIKWSRRRISTMKLVRRVGISLLFLFRLMRIPIPPRTSLRISGSPNVLGRSGDLQSEWPYGQRARSD